MEFPIEEAIGCRRCGVLHSPASEGSRCPDCSDKLHRRHPHSLQKTLAWLITAIVLFIPANILPIMVTRQFSRPTESTILGGVLTLWHHESYLVSGIIFLASVLVPLAKMLSLLWLCVVCSIGYRLSSGSHQTLYEWTERLGRWSMIDVCVVAVLVALVQMGGLMSISPGPAGLAFAGMVISTMFAASSFDSRLIWDAIEKRESLRDD